MKKVYLLLAVCVIMALAITGCGSSDKTNANTINVYNWGEYIDTDTLDMFTEETGIKVNYTTVPTNEEMYSKLKAGGVNYDIIVPSDYMIGRMIEEDMLEKINFENVPNFEYIDEEFRNPVYDPANEYSAPYMWGTTALIYNSTMVDEADVGSWDVLWNEKYANQILMFDNSRDAIGIALKKLGYSYNTTDENQIREAAELLKQQKPLVQAYVMDQIFNKMESGEAAIAAYYAGDSALMREENEDLAISFPKEGSNLFVDAMCIPKGSKNKEGAEQFINFMLRPDIMALNTEEVYYSTPSTAAKELLPDEMKNDPTLYPSKQELERHEIYLNLPSDIRTLYDELWIEILSS